MFKLNESVFDEVTDQLQKNLNKFAADQATEDDQKLVEALELLDKSAETLELFGFDKEANVITKLISLSLNKTADEKDKVYFTLEDMKNNYPKEYQSLPDNLKNQLAVMYFTDPDFTQGSQYTIMAIEGGAKSYAYNSTTNSWDEIEYPLKSFAAKKNKSVKKDPATSGLTSKKMLHNLATKGWEFNAADDQNMAKDHKLKYFPEALHGIPVIYLEKGDNDYNAFCSQCAEKLQKDGKHIIGHVYEEGPNRECQMCGKELESAMGQEQYYKENADEIDNNMAKDKSHEGPDEYKREKLEEEYLDEVLHDDYDSLLHELDEIDGEDQVFI